jgi:transaldolase
MGMSTHVVGIKPPDKVWKTMKQAWDACEAAKVPVPDEVLEFFNHEKPDDAGVIVEIDESEAVSKYSEDGVEGFDVDIKKLPQDVTVVRFYNAY